MGRWTIYTAFAVGLAISAATAKADPVEDFYKGRNVSVLIGYSAGGGYDSYARVLARHMGKHIPGNPTLVPQNMPGAGSLNAANYLYNIAPKDGSVFGTFARGLPMEPLIGHSATRYEATKFTWLGSITNEVSVCATMGSRVKTWDDVLSKEFTVAGEGSGSDPDIFAKVLKSVFGAKLKLITGYPGASEMSLAMERGEIDGRCGWSWSTIKAQKQDWLRSKKLNIIVQLSLDKSPDLPDVPLIIDLAKNDRQKQILKLIFSRQVMGRPFAAPPGIPEDRARALRRAFEETMKDPEFRAEAEKQGLEVNPVNGEALQSLVRELYDAPKDVVAEVRTAIGAGAR
ncbi:MAG TPA: tripartite tricarboxylate transporter substrate-binding protein [Xanthobacteraceae bacterium]|nr:tripartite tricarboxylate transporter substrate-binding protein [Xanthobacteraceae bacterium]